jgi:hypothetical protein
MSVETLSPNISRNDLKDRTSVEATSVVTDDKEHFDQHEFEPGTDDELLAFCDAIVAVESVEEAKQQQNPDDKDDKVPQEEIARIFADAHDERIEEIKKRKRGLILERFVDNEIETFHAEFLQMEAMFEGRSSRSIPRYDGTTRLDFCTQDHERGRCDYLFTHIKKPNGTDKFEVRKVLDLFGQRDEISLVWQNDELRIRTDEGIELKGSIRERVLAQFFTDTLHASAEHFKRFDSDTHYGTNLVEENDLRAKNYLKTVRDDEYRLH